ncbi:phage tail sheath protein FI [Enterobacter sp. BIGb0383]|uniref:phage tail sheath family protein n=1 Tax=unclassified Enterobacter TaxID=2608935 RepID=UPI000F4AA7FA|nr:MULTISPECIES: phage tail sheath family protein [unclassified Enterobacter]ROP62299.1 phage tail sheath protein FI [Enterobacter sp. BIGb0383]ROS12460.1 phage tail sheath protein FI [Enterobacter sp. BIGb0359]
MAMVNPGVSISETSLTSVLADDAVTMPLFMSYTVTQASSVTTLVPVNVTSLTQAVSLFGGRGTLAYSLRHFFENRGQSCYVLPLGTGEEENTTRLTRLITALQSAELQESVAADRHTGLLLVPEMSELNDLVADDSIDPATLWYQGWQALLQLCLQGQQRFALLEQPEDPVQAIALSKQSFSADLCQNGAAWWPRLQTSYVQDGSDVKTYLFLSPLPAVAAVIQSSATDNGVWKPPANIALAKTLRPSRNILQSRDLLNQDGVYCNPIRSFAGKGVRLWGCRTLLNDESSPWRYIQTRLLANSVEAYLSDLARVFLFEPNNAQTWMKLQGQIWTWLRQQWLDGAFFGTTEEEAFTVNIGLNDTMSAEDISAGKMIIQLRLALLAPAEFIDINLTLDLRDGSATTNNGS